MGPTRTSSQFPTPDKCLVARRIRYEEPCTTHIRFDDPRLLSTYPRVCYTVPEAPRRACVRDEAKTRRTGALVKRERIWQRQHLDRLGNNSLAKCALTTSKHAVAGLVGASRWRGSYGASKLRTEHERAWRVREIEGGQGRDERRKS